MDNWKHFLTSKTIVAAALGFILNILAVFHVNLPTDIVPADIADQVVALSSAVLYIGAIFGRIVATKKLTLT